MDCRKGQSDRNDVCFSEAVQPFMCAHPNVSFMVLKDGADIVITQTVSAREALDGGTDFPYFSPQHCGSRSAPEPIAQTSDPQSTVSVEENCSRPDVHLCVIGGEQFGV